MTPILLRVAVAAVRAWTRVYTFGLPPSLRDARRAEVESDLWECRADGGAVLPLQIAGRLLLGIFDDLWWRVEEVNVGPRSARSVLVATGVAVLAVMSVWIAMVMVTRPVDYPPPPAPPYVRWSYKEVKAPAPPPPPPPPCNPPGIGRKPFSPCTPY